MKNEENENYKFEKTKIESTLFLEKKVFFGLIKYL